jgi:hypothetical protein
MDIDRGCLSKKPWFDKAEAKRIAQSMTRRYGEEFHLYRCPNCAHYHVGHAMPEPVRLESTHQQFSEVAA